MNAYLANVNEQAEEQMLRLTKQMAKLEVSRNGSKEIIRCCGDSG